MPELNYNIVDSVMNPKNHDDENVIDYNYE